jgi:hypothetical protein
LPGLHSWCKIKEIARNKDKETPSFLCGGDLSLLLTLLINETTIEKTWKNDDSNFIVKKIIRAIEMEKRLGSITEWKQEIKLGVEKS